MNYRHGFLVSLAGLFFLCIISSCNGSFEDRITKIIGTHLIFPSEMSCYVDGDNLTMSINNILPSDEEGVKLVYYFGPEECQSCLLMKIQPWEERIKMLFGSNTNCVFIFSSQISISDLIVASRLSPDSIFVIDYHNSFHRKNKQIPKDQVLRSWLVDNNGLVLLCGNPAEGNDDLINLYKTIIHDVRNR